MEFNLDFPRAYGGPVAEADFRAVHEDFVVDEDLGFEPEGEGEHQYLQVKKRGENTQWVAKQIALFARVKEMDVGYCGLKDRRAVTTQWFSIYMPKRDSLDWAALGNADQPNLQVLHASKGQKKLRRGQHRCNRFVITLRNVKVSDSHALVELLHKIANEGVPNYFGEQRFGRGGNNLTSASRWLDEGKPIHQCGPKHMLMSAARSYLFNLVLAERVRLGTWACAVDGDQVNATGEPTGPLWGRGRSATTAEALVIESRAYAPILSWVNGLEHCGLQQERRSFVLIPQNLNWQYMQDEALLKLDFALAPGQYATSILSEISRLNTLYEDPL